MGKGRPRRRRLKVRFKQQAQLVHKADAARTTRPDTTKYGKAPSRIPDNAATFKIKVRRK